MKVFDIEGKYSIEPCGSAYINGSLIVGSVRTVGKKTYFIDSVGNASRQWAGFKRHDVTDCKRMNILRERIQ